MASLQENANAGAWLERGVKKWSAEKNGLLHTPNYGFLAGEFKSWYTRKVARTSLFQENCREVPFTASSTVLNAFVK